MQCIWYSVKRGVSDMKIIRGSIIISIMIGIIGFVFCDVYGASAYKNASDAQVKITDSFNTVFPVPKQDNFFNTNVFTQPFFHQDNIRDELKKIGIYIKELLDKTTLGVSVSQNNKDTINKAWFELSDALNTLLNTVSTARALNKIDATKPITEGKYLVSLNKKQFSDLLDTLKQKSLAILHIKSSLKVAWNDFSQTKDIKEILLMIAMQLNATYDRVIESGNAILAKKG